MEMSQPEKGRTERKILFRPTNNIREAMARKKREGNSPFLPITAEFGALKMLRAYFSGWGYFCTYFSRVAAGRGDKFYLEGL